MTKPTKPKGHTLDELEIKRQEFILEQRRIELMEGLPHLHGWKFYPWSRAFFESTNKICLLTASNQIGKSTSQIRKVTHWATAVDLWPSLWKKKPKVFWYFYPSMPVATAEFDSKWKDILPAGKFKDDPVYGWSEERKNKQIHALHFNSGVTVYFHSYSQSVTDLQAATVDYMAVDEEMPVELFDELMFRLSASNGYFSMVFTATLGQEFWRLAMEPGEKEEEKLPGAFKQTVSTFDCQFYEDGTPSHWTNERIQDVIARCRNHDEVQRRVFGRFIMETTGRKVPSFDAKLHMKPDHPVPKEWITFAGVDPGSGGKENHPAAIIFVAVRPDFKEGRVFLGWRGDGIQTTAGDVLEKFVELKRSHKLTPAAQKYDWGCRDFFLIAANNGEPFTPADKNQERGTEIVDTLFKYNMLYVYETPELGKLATELSTLRKETRKNKAADDMFDALRYCVATIPWDWSGIALPESPVVEAKPKTDIELQIEARRREMDEAHEHETLSIEAEISEWNEAYG